MSIPVECAECFSSFQIPTRYAGRGVRCKTCDATIRVPFASQSGLQSRVQRDVEQAPWAQQSGAMFQEAQLGSETAFDSGARSGGMVSKIPLVTGGVFLILFFLALVRPDLATTFYAVSIGVAGVFYVWGQITLLMVAFRDGSGSGLFCLILAPVYAIYMACTKWSKVVQPVCRILVASGLVSMAMVARARIAPDAELDLSDSIVQRDAEDQAAMEHQEQDDALPVAPSVLRDPSVLASDDADNDRFLYSLGDVNPQLPELDSPAFQKTSHPHVNLYVTQLERPRREVVTPGDQMKLCVYVPPGEHLKSSLPCVLVPPSGTNLLTGSDMGRGPEYPEHIPYVRAGCVVITFTMDGSVDGPRFAGEAEYAEAYRDFQAAAAGLVNARIAFLFAQRKISVVDPQQIFIAGHSSAATLALLYAAHEPDLAGCIAYAPQADAKLHLTRVMRAFDPQMFPGIEQFMRRSSPDTHIAEVQCPVFAYHAAGDVVTSAQITGRYCAELQRLGKDVTFLEGQGDSHYGTMISEGIPAGLKWLSERAALSDSSSASPLASSTPGTPASPGAQVRHKLDGTTQDAEVQSRVNELLARTRKFHRQKLLERSRRSAARTSFGDASAAGSRPPGTVPLEPGMELTAGMQVVARRVGIMWDVAEILEVTQDGRVKLHFLRLPSAFDRVLLRSEICIQLPPDQIEDELLREITFDIRQINHFSIPDKDSVEQELNTLVGYISGSLDIASGAGSVTVQVIRGSPAEQRAKFALARQRLWVTER